MSDDEPSAGHRRVVPVIYVRLPPVLKAAAEEEAKRLGVSVNVLAMRALEHYLMSERERPPIVKPPRRPRLRTRSVHA